MKIGKHKIASIVLLMVFFSQQVSWACGYNLSLLVNPSSSPLIYQDHGQFNLWVARRVYSLAKPSFRHNPKDLKSAYQWLKQPATETVPCSAYVLYNLLQAKGIKPKIEDISASLISLDLKAGNLKPPFAGNRIDNSLYAMAKTAEAQGLKLIPVKLSAIDYRPPGHGLASYSQSHRLLTNLTPFIVHLSYGGQSGHFVLVTKVDAEKVYFFYDKGDTFLPVEKFLEEFSGYCLLSSISVGDSLPAGRQEHCSVPTIADSESKTILGAGRSYHGRSVNISGLFKKPSAMESVIGIASSIGGAFFMPTNTSLWATAAGAGIQVGGGLLFKDSMWGRIATGVASGAVTGGLSGVAKSSWHGLSWNWTTSGIGAAKGLGMQGTIEGIKSMKFGDAHLRSSVANLLAIPVGQAIEGGLSAKFNVGINGMDYSKANSSFWKGAWMGATFQGSLTNKAEGWKKWAPAIAYYGGQSASIAVEAFGPKKYSSLYSTGISTAFNALTNVAAMGQDDKLWKVLGKSMADGALRGGLSIGLQKLTKDMRITEGAFLEMAGASLISAGVESTFGKWSGEGAVSRKGIFWDNLQKSWKGAMQDVVTFGAARGYMLGTSGAYAFLKMSELGSNVGNARASGLSAFDSAHWAFNQHVGSTYHNAAVNTLSNTVWNRVDNVKYVYGVGGKGTKFIAEVTQRELNKSYGSKATTFTSVGKKTYYSDVPLSDTDTFARVHYNSQANKYYLTFADGKMDIVDQVIAPGDKGQIRVLEDGKNTFIDEAGKRQEYYLDGKILIDGQEKLQTGITTILNLDDPRVTGVKAKPNHVTGKIDVEYMDGTKFTVDKIRGGPFNSSSADKQNPDTIWTKQEPHYSSMRAYGRSPSDSIMLEGEVLRDELFEKTWGDFNNRTKQSGVSVTGSNVDAPTQVDNTSPFTFSVAGGNGVIVEQDGKLKYVKPYEVIPKDAVRKNGSFTPDSGNGRVAGKYGAIVQEEGKLVYLEPGKAVTKDAKMRRGDIEEINTDAYQISEGTNSMTGNRVWKVQGDPLNKKFYNKDDAQEYRTKLMDPSSRDLYFREIAGNKDVGNQKLDNLFWQKGDKLEAVSGEKYKLLQKIFSDAGYRSHSLKTGKIFELVRDGDNKGYVTINEKGRAGFYLSALDSAEQTPEISVTREQSHSIPPAKLSASGIGEGSTGNKFIEGYIRNDPDTMSDVGQPIITMDKISQAPKVNLQGMSDAQYDKLLSDIDNPGQTNVPEWTPDHSTIEKEHSYNYDDTLKTKTINYWNKNRTLNQKVVINSNGERSVERYDDNNGDTVFYLFKNRDGKIDDVDGYNNNGQLINVQKRDDIAGGAVIESAVYDKNGRDYTMIEERYHKESGNKIDRMETKVSTPPIIKANNIANDYFSDLAATSRGAQNTDSAAIIVRKGGAGELTDSGFKVETPTEKMVSGIGDVYKGEFKGAIPPNALIQPKPGIGNTISPPGKASGYFYYDIHKDEMNR